MNERWSPPRPDDYVVVRKEWLFIVSLRERGSECRCYLRCFDFDPGCGGTVRVTLTLVVDVDKTQITITGVRSQNDCSRCIRLIGHIDIVVHILIYYTKRKDGVA